MPPRARTSARLVAMAKSAVVQTSLLDAPACATSGAGATSQGPIPSQSARSARLELGVRSKRCQAQRTAQTAALGASARRKV